MSSEETPPKIPDLPTPEEFFLKVGLYLPLRWKMNSNGHQLVMLSEFSGPLDAFCIDCQRESIFYRPGYPKQYVPDTGFGPRVGASSYSEKSIDSSIVRGGFLQWDFQCTRNVHHTMKFWANVTLSQDNEELKQLEESLSSPEKTVKRMMPGGHLTKVGQVPSLADLYEQDIRKYRRHLAEKYSDFSRAVGLFAHGIGAGSFVYLRRIFEGLIEEAHAQAMDDVGWDEDNYKSQRWDERIVILKDRLPEYLVKNAKIYSILSKGVHELSEDSCLQYFPVLRLGIECILDDKIRRKEDERKRKETESALGAIHGNLKG